ncbi:hypothetical protein [Azospirillum sp.]|uniref:hypothetical protein n=1 Tax=Azospirillum sp. TaxID=34012 RepID=UPI002D50DF88|nr:hypothetical protein [Azospirillum sp.]HYD69764.1 hypothetical protein [Azospirillum sp.]
MSAPAPQSAAVELWNRLKDIGGDDGIELDRIIWQLRKLAGRQPADFLTRLGLGWALLLRGRRNEALPHVEAAYGLRHGQGWIEKVNLTSVLLDVGLLVEVKDIIDQLLTSPDERSEGLYASAHGYALRAGDLNFLKASLDAPGVKWEEASDFASMLDDKELGGEFSRHQRVVESILGPLTCTFGASIYYDDEGVLKASLEYHTELMGRSRLELYRRVTRAKMESQLLSAPLHIVIGICGPQVQSVENLL